MRAAQITLRARRSTEWVMVIGGAGFSADRVQDGDWSRLARADFFVDIRTK
jgi:hypothetical protein